MLNHFAQRTVQWASPENPSGTPASTTKNPRAAHYCGPGRESKRPQFAAFLLFLVMMAVLLLCPSGSFAASSDFETETLDTKAVISQNHVISVTETITVNFNQSAHHGISRYIPITTGAYKVSNIKAEGGDLYTSMETGSNYSYYYVQIGDADRTVTGRHTYTLSYDLVCFKDDSTEKDYLSLDLFPSEWPTSVNHATMTLTLPKDIDWNQVNYYSGSYGSTDGLDSCLAKSVDEGTNTLTITGYSIPRYFGVTIQSDLPEGYWVNPSTGGIFLYLLYGLLVLIPLILLVMWFLWGRDPKIVQTVEFYPPENMTPAEIGYVIDESVENTDITSMFLYYASKGYLKIREYGKHSFELTKLKDIDSSEKSFSRYLFNQLFRHGDVVDMDNLPEGFGDDMLIAKEKLEGEYDAEKDWLHTGASYFARAAGIPLLAILPLGVIQLARMSRGMDTNPVWLVVELILQGLGIWVITRAFDRKQGRTKGKNIFFFALGAALTGAAIAVAALFSYMMLSNVLVPALLAASMIVSYVFVALMKARTKDSAELMGRILGFREFIRVAEYDRLKKLSDENPSYFFDIMPYAYVMGMSTKWAKKFADIHVPKPAWYDSYDTTSVWTAMWYADMFHYWGSGFSGEYSSAARAAATQEFLDTGSGDGGFFGGGDGFSGGGFSGGGFGGGGGGAW